MRYREAILPGTGPLLEEDRSGDSGETLQVAHALQTSVLYNSREVAR